MFVNIYKKSSHRDHYRSFEPQTCHFTTAFPAFSALLQLTTASLLFYDPQITTREALSQRISAPTSRIHAALLTALLQHYYIITTALLQL